MNFAEPIRGSWADERPRRTGVSPWVHAILLATAFCVFAWSFALPAGTVLGAVGTIVGAIWATSLERRRFRLPVILGAALVSAAAGVLIASALSSSTIALSIVGPTAGMQLIDGLMWATLAFAFALSLRAIALRFRVALVLEGAVVVIAVATTVSAHRDGMIARPLEISDWFWMQGIDPVTAFLGVGLVGGILLAATLAHGRTRMRTFVQLVLVLFLGIYIAAKIQSRDSDPRKSAAGNKLQQDNDARSQAKNAGGGKAGEGSTQADGGDGADSPFSGGLPRSGSGASPRNQPAAIVVFHRDVTPGAGVFYFRHAVFSQFNGSRLVESTTPDFNDDVERSFPAIAHDIPGPQHTAAGRELVATDVALVQNHTRMFALADPVSVAPLVNPAPARFRRAYSVVSAVITKPFDEMISHRPGSPKWSEEAWQHYTELPRDERYHRLAAELQSTLRQEYQDDPFARAMLVKRYLESEATYSYKNNYDDAVDPTAAFLFSEEKKGYCVHLSHAAAFLLRAMGVPARVSAGYAVPASQLAGGSSLLIKSSDAHAWAEIFLDGLGWVPIEVSPEKSDVEPTPFGERDLQQLLGEMARGEGRVERESKPSHVLLDAIKAAISLLPKIATALLLLAYVMKLWRLWAPTLASRRARPRVAYRAALDRLSAIGAVRTLGESRESFSSRIYSMAPSFGPLTAIHIGAAFGSRAVLSSQRDLDELTTLSSGVGRELRRSVPRWRWLLGLLNPVSWLFSR